MGKDDVKKPSITWQQIVGAVAMALIMGSIGFFGATIKDAIEKIDKNQTEIELLKNDLGDVISDIQNTITEMGTMSANVKKLEIVTTKLETIIERIER